MKKIFLVILLFVSSNGFSQSLKDTLFKHNLNIKLLETAAINELNRYRKSLGLCEVVVDSLLTKNAKSHSAWMEKTGIFEHSDYFGSECILYGGHLFLCSYEKNGVSIIKGWINSPPHNRILKDPEAKKVGIGITIIKDSINGLYATLIFN